MDLGSILSAFHAMVGHLGRITLWNQWTAMRSASQVDNHPIQDHSPSIYWPPVYMNGWFPAEVSQRKRSSCLGYVLQPKAKRPTSLNHDQITQPPRTHVLSLSLIGYGKVMSGAGFQECILYAFMYSNVSPRFVMFTSFFRKISGSGFENVVQLKFGTCERHTLSLWHPASGW